MPSSFAQRVAEAIFAGAQSGSAVWDELNGPSAVLRHADGQWVITIPQGYDEEGVPSEHVVLVTVECGVP